MKRMLLGLVAAVACFAGKAQEKWDLRRCVDYAMANNISVKQADLQTRFSQLNLQQAHWSQWPVANFQASSGFRFGLSEDPTTGTFVSKNIFNTQLGFSSNVTLFNWFAKKYAVQSAAISVQADEAQVKKVQDDVALNVAVGYLQALLARQQVMITSIQVKQTLSQLDLTRKKVNAGSLPELNAVQLEAQLARDSSALISAEANVQQLLLQLKAILNVDAAAPFDIAAPPVELIPVESLAELQPDVVYALALVNLPQQRVNELRIGAAQKSVLSARASMYPSFSAFGGLNSAFVNNQSVQNAIVNPRKNTGAIVNIGGTDYNVVAPGFDNVQLGVTPFFSQLQNNFGQNIGIGVTVPILNGGALRSNWQRSRLNVQQLELQRQNDNQTLKQDIYKAYNDATASLQKFNASRKTVEAGMKAYEYARKRYDANLLSSYELISSQNELFRAQTDMLIAQFDYVFKMKLLEFYKGQGLKL